MVHAKSESITDPGTMFRVHSAADRDSKVQKKRGEYVMEGGSLKAMEEKHVQKFQSFQEMTHVEGSKVKVSKEERKRLKKQLKEGKLHEEMLNRRSKMKADKFCK